jgi:hypothetical protein
VEFAVAGDPLFGEVLERQLPARKRLDVMTSIHRTIATYDPRQEIVVFGHHPEEGYHFLFTASSKPPPPECRL